MKSSKGTTMSQPPAPLPNQQSSSTPPRKQQRITRACDFCHKRSIRCSPTLGEPRCKNCLDFDVDCTFNRPIKRRGVRSAKAKSASENGKSPGEPQNRDMDGRMVLAMRSSSNLDAPFRIPDHYIAVIGGIFTSVIGGPMSESSYEHARVVLLALVSLLSSLENGITRDDGAAARLSKTISEIDDYMASQRQNDPVTHGATYPDPISLPTKIEQDLNSNVDPELQVLMGAFTSRMDGSNLTATADSFDAAHAPNGFGNGHDNEQMQFQLPPGLAQNISYRGTISDGLFGNGMSGDLWDVLERTTAQDTKEDTGL